MGTWALPNTKEKAQALQELMQKPLKANDKSKDKLYDLYGDDGLFDDIDDRRYEEGKDYDIRFLVATYINNSLEYYKKSPEKFNLKFDKEAIKILEIIVKEQGV